MVNLETTNWILAAIAVASVVQTLIVIGVGIASFRLYRQSTQALAELETRHVEPLRREVEGILGHVEAITSRISQQTERVDDAITGTIGRVDETAERMKYSVREKVSHAAGIIRGVRAVIASLLVSEPERDTRAEAGGRA